MYGYRGNDNYFSSKDLRLSSESNFLIKDFKSLNDSDKINIKPYSLKLWGDTKLEAIMEDFNGKRLPAIRISSALIDHDKAYSNLKRRIYLEGIGIETVKGWISIADGILPESYKKQGFTESDLPNLKINNPIVIE